MNQAPRIPLESQHCEIQDLNKSESHWAHQREKLRELRANVFGNRPKQEQAAQQHTPIQQAPDHIRSRAIQLAIQKTRNCKRVQL